MAFMSKPANYDDVCVGWGGGVIENVGLIAMNWLKNNIQHQETIQV